MAVPLFVAWKSMWDIISNFLIFGQHSQIQLGVIGVMLNFIFCKGFFGVIILTLKTVVEEQAASIAVSYALLVVNLNILILGSVLSIIGEQTGGVNDLLLYVASGPQVITTIIFIYIAIIIRRMHQDMEFIEEPEILQSMQQKFKSLATSIAHLAAEIEQPEVMAGMIMKSFFANFSKLSFNLPSQHRGLSIGDHPLDE